VQTKGINMKTRLLFSIIIISFLGVNTSKAQEIQNKIAPTQNENGISRKASFNLEEIKVRWKKAALENCTGTPCVFGNTCSVVQVADPLQGGVQMAGFIPITRQTIGATGIGTATGLPPGLNATWSNNIITISGTPTGGCQIYNYSIPLLGCSNTVIVTGTINLLC
jgi:hypothetical protein